MDEPSSLHGADQSREDACENTIPVNTKNVTTWTVTSRTSEPSPRSQILYYKIHIYSYKILQRVLLYEVCTESIPPF
jgi:hypothetical protein